MPNKAYPKRHIDIEIPNGSRDHVIVPDIVRVMFNIDIESIGKTRSILSNCRQGTGEEKGAHVWFKRY